MNPEGAQLVAESAPLVFFYKGSALPTYAAVSLSRASAAWEGPVILLHNQIAEPLIDGVHTVNFTSWYDSRSFADFQENSTMDPNFRSGFWFHATERFFVISQWLAETGLSKFAHAELDVDVSCSSQQMKVLDEWGSGLFYPFGTHKHAGASFLYCNSPDSLTRLVDYICQEHHSEDEMHVLWDFGVANPDQVHRLPSHTYFEPIHPDLELLTCVPAELVGGLFDVQPFGTWLFGQDPRNAVRSPDLNHFVFEEIGSPSLGSLSFRYDFSLGQVSVKSETSTWMKILALHIHSKNFGFVSNRLRSFLVVVASNFSFSVPLTTRNLNRFFLKKIRRLIDRLYLAVKRVN